MIVEKADRLSLTEEYYFSRKLKEIAELKKKGHRILNLGIGSPDLPPSTNVIDSLIRHAKSPSAHGYQSYQGIPEFRQAIANFTKKYYAVSLDPDSEILPLIGSKEGIMHLSMAFVNPGDKVLIPDPGYPTYRSVSNLVKADTITYSLEEDHNWNINIEEIKQKPLDEVKLMWLNFPHMPTGAKADKNTLIELLALAEKHRFLIVNDNPYSLLHSPPAFSIFQLPGAHRVAVEFNSMSKSHNMAGWRLGWVCGQQEYLSTLLKVKSNMDSGMFLPVQMAAVTALTLDDEFYQQQRAIYTRRRKIAEAIFDALQCNYTSQEGMFVWAKIPDEIESSEKMTDNILSEFEVFITPGSIFGENGNRFMRISLCSDEDILKEVLNRIKPDKK